MGNLADKITQAIAAHSKWKSTLKTAVTTGSFAGNSGDVAKDDRCDLGKFLHGDAQKLSAAEKGADLAKVRELHMTFHKVASSSLAAALRRDTATYERDTAPTGPFTQASSALVQALVAWRTRLG